MNSSQPESPRATIANQIVRLHSEYYGRGPTKAKTYMVDDLIVVVLEETFTPVERTLIDATKAAEEGEAAARDGAPLVRARGPLTIEARPASARA